MEFRILGPLEAVGRGGPLPLGGARQRALLALLLTRANEVVSADRLIEELWEGSPPDGAANALQYHVSQLRKALAPADVIATRHPGYLLQVADDELDLFRFERLVADARNAEPHRAAALLQEALELWRGPPLADLEHEPFAEAEIARLEELRLTALESRLEADLALGRDAAVVAELEALVRERPLRERPRGLLMLALYRTGRQAEALDAYREGRALLVDELGIEPGPALQALERAILRHDPALGPHEAAVAAATEPRRRAILVVASRDEALDDLVAVAEPLARSPARDVILARLLAEDEDLAAASAALAGRRRSLAERDVAVRVAAYTSSEPGGDAALLAAEHDVDLLLVDAPVELLASGRLGNGLAELLARAPCDVGVLAGRLDETTASGPVVTPFGGAEHDWSAIEVAAWLAGSLGTTLRLVGTEANRSQGRRDASRLLARASLLVQEVIGIVAEPMLVPAGEAGMLSAVGDARLLVVGLSDRWQTEGVGPARLAIARALVPTLFVRRGLRPSGVAPDETMTRFTWTLGAQRGT